MEDWFRSRGDRLASSHLYADPTLPLAGEFDWLVIMGGGMSVNDEDRFPWLAAEKRMVRQAIDQGKIVLGVCLGAQMIAAALGARVRRHAVKEIGWFPIEREPSAADHPLARWLPPRADVFHWHGETFDLPEGAVHLARSAACRHQAFAWGQHVLALQFHLEVTPALVRGMIEGSAADLVPGPWVQTPAQMTSDLSRCDACNVLLAGLLAGLS